MNYRLHGQDGHATTVSTWQAKQEITKDVAVSSLRSKETEFGPAESCAQGSRVETRSSRGIRLVLLAAATFRLPPDRAYS